jgi:hypothetical protein
MVNRDDEDDEKIFSRELAVTDRSSGSSGDPWKRDADDKERP